MKAWSVPPDRARRADTPEAASTSTHDRALVLARIAWPVAALLVVGLFTASVPVDFEYLRTECFRAACAAGPRFTPEAQEMEALGLSYGFYAAYFTSVGTVFALAHVAFAAFLFWRRSDEPVALLAALTFLTWGVMFAGPLDALAEVHPYWRLPAAFVTYIGSVSFVVFFSVFPDGRFVPSQTRWLVLGWAGVEFLSSFFPDASFSPTHWPPFLVVGTFVVGLGGPVVAQVHRYRRVSNPLERQQTKWVAFGLAAAISGFLGLIVLALLIAPSLLQHGPIAGPIGIAALYLFLLFVPLSITMAILRHRLWDIDLVINRALVYGALTACVVSIYVLVVGYLGALLKTEGNLLISLIATGLVAVLFAPLRDRLQRSVNRLMYGERDDPYKVISRLGERLEGTLAPEAVLPAITRTVREALKLPYAAITLKEGEGFAVAAGSGNPVRSTLRLPLVYQGETVGELRLGPRAGEQGFSSDDRRLLDDLARQAGIAVHAVRLTTDLQRSRERLVSTREEERRRLRRDLHDGLGPMLGSLTLKLDVARDLVEEDPAAVRNLLGGLKTQAQDAVVDIRRLVYALRPPALDDLGLLGATHETATQYSTNGLRISVYAPKQLPPLPAAVEVAAYRIVQEALTNVVRHAEAGECVVSLAFDDAAGKLRLEVSDDGRGLSPALRQGVGIASMRERAEELGGSCTVESLPAGGTHVHASLPCARPIETEGTRARSGVTPPPVSEE